MKAFCVMVGLLICTAMAPAMFQVEPPLTPPEPVIQSGTGVAFVAEPNGALRITEIPSVLHQLEQPPTIGLGKDGDWADVADTDLYTNVGGTWIWVR